MSCNTETRPRFVPETEFAVDAALEERGFEPQVPLAKTSGLSGGTGVPQGRKGQSRRRGLYWGRPRVSNPLPSGESATLREPARVCRPSAGQGRLHGKVPAGEARAFGKDEQGGNSIVQKIPNSITQRSSRLIAFPGQTGRLRCGNRLESYSCHCRRARDTGSSFATVWRRAEDAASN